MGGAPPSLLSSSRVCASVRGGLGALLEAALGGSRAWVAIRGALDAGGILLSHLRLSARVLRALVAAGIHVGKMEREREKRLGACLDDVLW